MINTSAVNLDSNPFQWLSDQRVQKHLPREHTLAFVNLLHYAMQLSATTGSDFVDGEFSYSAALVMVPELTPEAIVAMVGAYLVTQVDGDRWAVDFITPQTSHEALQNSADGKARAGKTRREIFAAEKQSQAEAEAKADHRRELDKERQRVHRAKDLDEPADVDHTEIVDDAASLAGGQPATSAMYCHDCGKDLTYLAVITVDGINYCYMDGRTRQEDAARCAAPECTSRAMADDPLCYTHYCEQRDNPVSVGQRYGTDHDEPQW